MSKKNVYFFGGGKAEGNKEMRDLLGGKGANLAEMTNAGLPVPPGFTITTDACIHYSETNKYPEGMDKQVEDAITKLEKVSGKILNDEKNPLLVSVRSGAKFSMPGMMDTVLNLGMNDKTVVGLAEKTKNKRMAYDSYRRFINMFGDVVMGVSHEFFEHKMDELKKEKGVKQDTDLTSEDLMELVERYKKVVIKYAGKSFPLDPREQLIMSINAVFGSWSNPRAKTYRRLNDLPDNLGTAVNVQTMVFGNMGDTSGTGVSFTRNPATGTIEHYGECLINAQGEDVVAGIRTPQPIESLEPVVPQAYKELIEVYDTLEKHYKEMQDFEFTIEEGKLYILQTRSGKRTVQAAIKIAVDMEKEGLITKEEAVLRVPPAQLDHLLHPTIDPDADCNIIAKGLPASPGAALGKVVFTAEDAVDWKHERDEKVILVRTETSPEDIEGMDAANGILTARGGMTSHAAVVARGMGKCCVAGCEKIHIDYKKKQFTVGKTIVNEGDLITLNGNTGELILGEVDLIKPELKGEFKELMKWADEIRVMNVRTNADSPKDSEVAIDFGAEGIGLCRTEHMFFDADRIKSVREMILSDDEEGRRKALKKLLPMQRGDFEGIFKAMAGKPVTIRLLDPPLHEFLPHENKHIVELAKEMEVDKEILEKKVKSLHEMNPMLGHRGCRLAITYPEIAEMQARAIIEAACNIVKEKTKVIPEIMIPLVGEPKELEMLKKVVVETADKVMEEKQIKVDYMIGTMIEIPRAALLADKIAESAEFFSYGTNDLTQMTYGFSRDDIGKYLPEYLDKKIFEKDPFQVLDQDGVGQLVQLGMERGRKTRPDLKVGICGEHGGEPNSVEFCHRVGMNYVSCSPYRVPIARLAAAHAQIKDPRKTKK